MAKEKSGNISILVSIAVITILVAALISALATESQNKTTLTGVSNEAISLMGDKDATGHVNSSLAVYTLAKANTGWKTDSSDCNIIVSRYGNSSTDFTATTDYTYTSARVVTVQNTTTTFKGTIGSNATTVSYKYCADDYLNSSWGRNILNITPGLIAIALLVAVIGGAYMLLKKEED